MEVSYEESNNQSEEMIMNKPSKRGREEEDNDEDEWQVVEGKKTKKLRQGELNTYQKEKKHEVYISCQEPLPKQFAMARLLRDQKICDILQIKYLNSYKIRVQFKEENDIEKLITNETFKNKGWRYSNSSEVSYSYGVIKDVDLDMPPEEILKNISCPESVELISLKRLDRRNKDKDNKEKKWCPSESVRLCFKGSFLPSFVYVHDVRINVDPYVYPVTQCYRCWKLGHTTKTCSIKKETCPKCSGDHANCDTNVFTCVNCSGCHMAMSRTCPAFLKEKAIRDIMAEYNYTYSKAAQMYIHSPRFIPAESKKNLLSKIQTVTSTNKCTIPNRNLNASYSNKVSEDTQSSSNSIILNPKQTKKKSKKKNL